MEIRIHSDKKHDLKVLIVKKNYMETTYKELMDHFYEDDGKGIFRFIFYLRLHLNKMEGIFFIRIFAVFFRV